LNTVFGCLSAPVFGGSFAPVFGGSFASVFGRRLCPRRPRHAGRCGPTDPKRTGALRPRSSRVGQRAGGSL